MEDVTNEIQCITILCKVHCVVQNLRAISCDVMFVFDLAACVVADK